MFLKDGPIDEDYTLEGILFSGFRIYRMLAQTSKFIWGFWNDYKHVVYNGKTYAKIGKRLYTQHAVDRMSPSGLGNAAGGAKGRSIAPDFVEEVTNNGTRISRIVEGEIRTQYVLGNVSVITEKGRKIVISVITK